VGARRPRDAAAAQTRYEYENAFARSIARGPLAASARLASRGWASRNRFQNKIGDALDISHVQMAPVFGRGRSTPCAQVMVPAGRAPGDAHRPLPTRETKTVFHGQDEVYGLQHPRPKRATFPGSSATAAQPDVRSGKAPMTGWPHPMPKCETLEAVGVVASAYEPIEPKFRQFQSASRRSLQAAAQRPTPVWVGTRRKQTNGFIFPISMTFRPGHRSEPITIYSETPPHLLRQLGNFDVTPRNLGAKELDVWLLAGRKPSGLMPARALPFPDPARSRWAKSSCPKKMDSQGVALPAGWKWKAPSMTNGQQQDTNCSFGEPAKWLTSKPSTSKSERRTGETKPVSTANAGSSRRRELK